MSVSLCPILRAGAGLSPDKISVKCGAQSGTGGQATRADQT
jgi:hypothetical protein